MFFTLSITLFYHIKHRHLTYMCSILATTSGGGCKYDTALYFKFLMDDAIHLAVGYGQQGSTNKEPVCTPRTKCAGKAPAYLCKYTMKQLCNGHTRNCDPVYFFTTAPSMLIVPYFVGCKTRIDALCTLTALIRVAMKKDRSELYVHAL